MREMFHWRGHCEEINISFVPVTPCLLRIHAHPFCAFDTSWLCTHVCFATSVDPNIAFLFLCTMNKHTIPRRAPGEGGASLAPAPVGGSAVHGARSSNTQPASRPGCSAELAHQNTFKSSATHFEGFPHWLFKQIPPCVNGFIWEHFLMQCCAVCSPLMDDHMLR